MSIATRTPVKHGYQIGLHFWLYEFRCRCKERGHRIQDGFCGGAVIIAPALMDALDTIRATFGSVTIVNGFRCWNYHEEIYRKINVQRAKEGLPIRALTRKSPHLTGEAVDLSAKEKLRWPFHESFLKDAGITGVGYKEGRVTHIDVAHTTFTHWSY